MRAPPAGLTEPGYAAWAEGEVARWRVRMLKAPGAFDKATRGVQGKINEIIPEAVHATLTTVIEGLTRTILTGADLTTGAVLRDADLETRDRRALAVMDSYRKTAAVEGGVAGAGGFWLALADFPALLTIKFKLLFDLAAIYGHEADRFDERLYILGLFQLAFSGAERRAEVFRGLEAWDLRAHPTDFEHFDWRGFQREYRDFIDLAKLAQLIPVVGAPIGALVNWKLTERVGEMAINGYRARALKV